MAHHPDPVDLDDLDLGGLSREDILSALIDAALIGAPEDAEFSRPDNSPGVILPACENQPEDLPACEIPPLSAPTGEASAPFYSPDQPRDERGRWSAGGGASAEDHAARREAASGAIRDYLKAAHQPTREETAALAGHLSTLTVKQLHGLRQEHGLKDPRLLKADFVTALHGYFEAHREKQAVLARGREDEARRAAEKAVPDGGHPDLSPQPEPHRSLAAAVHGKPGFSEPFASGPYHAVRHESTGYHIEAEAGSHSGRFAVVNPQTREVHSRHDTAEAAVAAVPGVNRLGTSQSEGDHLERARAAQVGKGAVPDFNALARSTHAANERLTDQRTGLAPVIPRLYEEVRQAHPGLSEQAFHDHLRELQRRDLATLQTFETSVPIREATGYPRERFPSGGRSGAPQGWVSFRPDAATRLGTSQGGADRESRDRAEQAGKGYAAEEARRQAEHLERDRAAGIGGKAVYELTPAEYKEAHKGQRIPKDSYYNREGVLETRHSTAVNQAVQLGRPVPLHVLAETHINRDIESTVARRAEEAQARGEAIPERLRTKLSYSFPARFSETGGGLSAPTEGEAGMSDISQEERDKLPEADFGWPDERKYPIRSQGDVDSAAKLIGKAPEDKRESIKRRIVAICKRKNLTPPESWTGDASHSAAFSASVPFDATGDPEQEGAFVLKEAPVVFRAGKYDFPADKGGPFEMTPEEIKAAVAAAPPEGVPISNEHNQRCFFQGKLGRFLPKVWPDGKGFGGTAKLAKPVLDLVGDTPIKLSANFDRLTKTLKDVTLTHTPRITDAALFAAFAEDQSDFGGPYKTTPHGQAALQQIHDVSAHHGAVCSDKEATMSALSAPTDAGFTSEAESRGLQAIHDTTKVLGAQCSLYDPEKDSDKSGAMRKFMATYSQDAAPSAREKELERQLAEYKQASEARFAALERDKEQARFTAALATFTADAAAFVAANGKRLYGKRDRDAVFAAYVQAARDDYEHPAEVHFSDEKGATQKGSRLAAFKAGIAARPETNLDVESIPGPVTALFAQDPPQKGQLSEDRWKELMGKSQFGQQLLREQKKAAQENGRRG